jgi:hypothetical protein
MLAALCKIVATRRFAGAAVAIGLLWWPLATIAHERKTAGAVDLVIGWADEPAFAGARNSVVVALSARGGPVAGPADLNVEISFGTERITLPLLPIANRPNEFHAFLVPTRAGTYAFRVTGKIGAQAVDVTSTCSDSTFHCVEDAAAIQFPVKDPTVAQLADRLERGLPRADRASDTATGATRLAIAALATSLAGIVLAVVVGWRSRTSTP